VEAQDPVGDAAGRPRYKRRRRPFWRRRRLFIVILAVLGAIVLTLVLLSMLSDVKPAD